MPSALGQAVELREVAPCAGRVRREHVVIRDRAGSERAANGAVWAAQRGGGAGPAIKLADLYKCT